MWHLAIGRSWYEGDTLRERPCLLGTPHKHWAATPTLWFCVISRQRRQTLNLNRANKAGQRAAACWERQQQTQTVRGQGPARCRTMGQCFEIRGESPFFSEPRRCSPTGLCSPPPVGEHPLWSRVAHILHIVSTQRPCAAGG